MERTGAAGARSGGGGGGGGDVLTLHQVDGGYGDGAGRDGDVLSQDLVLWGGGGVTMTSYQTVSLTILILVLNVTV